MESLLDPYGDRVMKSVPLPPRKPLTSDIIFSTLAVKPLNLLDGQKFPDWKLIMSHFHKSGIMSKEAIIRLIRLAMEVFSKDN